MAKSTGSKDEGGFRMAEEWARRKSRAETGRYPSYSTSRHGNLKREGCAQIHCMTSRTPQIRVASAANYSRACKAGVVGAAEKPKSSSGREVGWVTLNLMAIHLLYADAVPPLHHHPLCALVVIPVTGLLRIHRWDWPRL